MNEQFNNSLTIQKELGSNTQETSISQNTQNHGRIRSIERNLKITGFQEILRIGGISEISPRRPNMCFSMSKSKKLWQKEEATGSSWIKSKSTNY